MGVKFLKRGFFQRLFGIPATQPPSDPGCWEFSHPTIVVHLDRAPELSVRGRAVRLEGKGLPERVLLVHGEDGRYHAFQNRCRHMGRRLDPVADTETVQCCSVGKSTYGYDGRVLHGPASSPLKVLPVKQEGGRVEVTL
ncbi:MAG: Rieske 2Fe-2S domain-containing protein [Deltaproteobacteria bacterium]|nr:Rieske 2Fe-2S domain-containing protein [Deltaproteobacteria bacterium]